MPAFRIFSLFVLFKDFLLPHADLDRNLPLKGALLTHCYLNVTN